jgi:hypothetical protein
MYDKEQKTIFPRQFITLISISVFGYHTELKTIGENDKKNMCGFYLNISIKAILSLFNYDKEIIRH